MKCKIATIGDVHWGALPPEHLYEIINEIVIPALDAISDLKAIIQLGDWFDKRLSLDSQDSKMSMSAAVLLAQYGRQRGIPVRMIKGTLSHDFFQLQNYKALETEYPGYRVISSAEVEELFEGFIVLWMPEEYPTDYSHFYSPFFKNEDGDSYVYDGIFGHGEIDVAAGWSRMNEGERHYGGTPCHESAMLLEHSTGPVWFGHVHKRFRHRQRLGYPGSLTRWCHGEEEMKGFDILDVEQRNGQWFLNSVTVIENNLAPIYKTVIGSEVFTPEMPPDEILSIIRSEAEGVAKLRVKMDSYPIGVEELSVIRGALVNDPRIDIVSPARQIIENNSGSAEEEALNESMESQREVTNSRLSYLRDPGIPGEERLLRYLQEKYPDRANVTIEEVRELTAPVI